MSIQKKITDLTAKTGALEGTDVLVISDYNGSTYDTKKITGYQIVPYKVYITNISQTGTSAPTVTGGYSQLTGTITLARTTTGTYTLTNSVAEFTANNTFLFFQNSSGSVTRLFQYEITSTTVITIKTWTGAGALSDGLLSSDSIEIKIIN
jgi:hypothetical protein